MVIINAFKDRYIVENLTPNTKEERFEKYHKYNFIYGDRYLVYLYLTDADKSIP